MSRVPEQSSSFKDIVWAVLPWFFAGLFGTLVLWSWSALSACG